MATKLGIEQKDIVELAEDCYIGRPTDEMKKTMIKPKEQPIYEKINIFTELLSNPGKT
jgi:hypothetical protein